jgi:ATP-binding cassette subfamily B protein
MRGVLNLLNTYAFVFRFAIKGRRNRFSFISYILLSTCEAFIPIIQVYLLKKLIDSIMLVLNEGHSFSTAIYFIALQFLVFIISNIIINLKRIITTRLTQHSNFQLDQMTIQKLNQLPLIFFEKTENHNIIQRLSSGIGSKAITSITTIVDIFKNMITIIGYSILLFNIHWSLAFLLVLLLIPSLYTSMTLTKADYSHRYQQTPMLRRIGYLQSLFNNRNVQKELKIFGHGDYLLELWKKYFWKTANEQYDLEKKQIYKNNFLVVFNQLVNVGFMIGLIWLGRSGSITIGDFVAYSQLLSMAIGSLQFLASNVGNLINHSLTLMDFRNLIHMKDDPLPTSTVLEKPNNNRGIVVNNVTFRYPNSHKDILKNISLNIMHGERVAIVGDNGSGKSTLAKCLVGLYTPQNGEILHDGVDIKTIPLSEVLKRVTMMFQDFTKYELSIKENLALSNPIEETGQKLLDQIIHRIEMADQIYLLPEKELTSLSPSLENGIEFSGGQWQKIALGRALYKKADIIILDEPTAAIDPISESNVHSLINDICVGKTAIIITHRLASCLMADRIVVLREGEIVETGTHNELIAKNGLYHQMFLSQAKNYTKPNQRLDAS